MKSINLCFICDENYINQTIVAIASILHNGNNNIYNIYLIVDGMQRNDRATLEMFSNERCNINIIEVDSSQYEFLRKKDFPVTPVALFKFNLPSLLPDSVKKVLYLDADIIVQKNLYELYSTDIENVYAGVIKDFRGLTLKGDFRKRLNINFRAYFNSGVMLLNLDLMRMDNISESLLEYRINGTNYYMDQDAFNVIFHDKVVYLSFFYNFQLSCWRFTDMKTLANYYHLAEVEDKYSWIRQATILHFTADKPWDYYDYHASDIWLQYYLMSPISNIPLRRTSILEKEYARLNVRKYCQDAIHYPKEYNFSLGECIPYVSVVMPVYNAELRVRYALQSLQKQSLLNFEVICVDDGSSDGTMGVLEEFSKHDARIKIIHLKQNMGAGAARNIAIQHAKGKYVVFLDSDDALTKSALEKFYLKGNETQADMIICPTIEGDHVYASSLNHSYLPQMESFSPEDIPGQIFNITHGGPNGKCVRTKFIKDNKILFSKARRSEDIFFISCVLILSRKITYIDESLYILSVIPNEESLEHGILKEPWTFLFESVRVKNFLIDNNIYEKFKKSFLNSCCDRFAYNISALAKRSVVENKVMNGKLFVHQMLIKNNILEKMMKEFELDSHEEGFFFVESWPKLISFIKGYDSFGLMKQDTICNYDYQEMIAIIKNPDFYNSYIEEPIQELIGSLKKCNNVFLFGFNDIGRRAYNYLKEYGYADKVKSFVSLKSDYERYYDHVPVVRLKENFPLEKTDFVIASGFSYEVSLIKQYLENSQHNFYAVFPNIQELIFTVRAQMDKITYLKKQWLFPFRLVKRNSRIVLYGAGIVGKEYAWQLQRTGYAELVQWVDQNYSFLQRIFDITIEAPKNIGMIDFDYIVIAVKNFDVAMEMTGIIKSMGIDIKKVIWNS